MGNKTIDLHIFKDQLSVTNSVGGVRNLLTVWKGTSLTFLYDTITSKIVTLNYPTYVKQEDILLMEEVTYWYLGGNNG